MSGRLEPSQHNLGHRHIDKGFTGFWQGLVVLAQPSIAAQPSKGALHNPAMRQYLKAVDIIRALDDFQEPATQVLGPPDQLASVASVSPDQPQAGKLSYQLAQDQFGAIPVLDTGGVHHYRQDQP